MSNDENELEETLDDELGRVMRMIWIHSEAQEEGSDIYCPLCEINLPKRHPFFGWDKHGPSYYCSLCEYEFHKDFTEQLEFKFM